MPWRVVELPNGPSRVQAGTVSTNFPTKEAAEVHRRDILGDPRGERYELLETDENGWPLRS